MATKDTPETNTDAPRFHNRIHEYVTHEVLPDAGDRAAVAQALPDLFPAAQLGTSTSSLRELEAQGDTALANATALTNAVVSAILKAPPVREALATWVGNERVIEDPEVGEETILYYLEGTKADVCGDFQSCGWNVADTDTYRMLVSGGLKTVYGDPALSAVLTFPFGPGPADVQLMDGLARIGQAGLMTFLAGPSPDFFDVDSFAQLPLKKSLLTKALKREALAGYTQFRAKPHARYFALAGPDVAAREPFDPKNCPADGLEEFTEAVNGPGDVTRIGGQVGILQNLARSMTAYNWPQICGLDYGGTIDGLVLRTFAAADGRRVQISPVEVPIDDDIEMILQAAGIIPLRPIKNQNAVVVFEAATLKKALVGLNTDLNNAAKLATKLPVVLVECRFGHFIREAFLHLIGGTMPPKEVEAHLQKWANEFCCDSKGPVPEETRARRPFKSIAIRVVPDPEDPGRLQAEVELTPAFRLAAVTARLIIQAPKDDDGTGK